MSNKVRFDTVVTRAHSKEDRSKTDKIYYVGGEHINSNDVLIKDRGMIAGSTIGPMFYFGFKQGDVLFVSRNPHLRKAGMVTFNGICSEKTFVLETKNPDVLLQAYLPFVMQTEHFWKFIEDNKSGSVNFFTNWSTLAKYEFELPPIEEQRRIADLLWAMNDTLESYKDLLVKTDEMVKSRFIEMFGDERNIVPLMECGEIITGGTPPKKEVEFYNSKDIHFYKPNDCSDNQVTYLDDSNEFVSESARSVTDVFPSGTVLVTCIGTIGKIGILINEGTCNQQINAIIPNNKCISEYIAYAIWVNRNMLMQLSNATTVAIINKKSFSEFMIPFPKIEEQKKFAYFVQQVDKSKFALQQSIDSLQNLMKATINQELVG